MTDETAQPETSAGAEAPAETGPLAVRYDAAAAALRCDLAGQGDALLADLVRLLRSGGGRALDRSARREHVTASCFVFDPGLDHVLLALHRKVRLWLQLGGHVEPGDASCADAALREAREESGLAAVSLLGTTPGDVERIDVSAAIPGCAVHWDLGYVAIADAADTIAVSAESEELAWWPLDGLPADVPASFAARLTTLVTVARRRRDGSPPRCPVSVAGGMMCG